MATASTGRQDEQDEERRRHEQRQPPQPQRRDERECEREHQERPARPEERDQEQRRREGPGERPRRRDRVQAPGHGARLLDARDGHPHRVGRHRPEQQDRTRHEDEDSEQRADEGADREVRELADGGVEERSCHERHDGQRDGGDQYEQAEPLQVRAAIGEAAAQPISDGEGGEHGGDRVGPDDRRRSEVRRYEARRGDLHSQARASDHEDDQRERAPVPRSGRGGRPLTRARRDARGIRCGFRPGRVRRSRARADAASRAGSASHRRQARWLIPTWRWSRPSGAVRGPPRTHQERAPGTAPHPPARG
jgi:hypothetical protein